MEKEHIIVKFSAWQGTAEELAELATQLSSVLPGAAGVPSTSRWHVIDYRTKQILGPAQGKRYNFSHLLQLLAARVLVSQGWTRQRVAEWVKAKTPGELLPLLEGGSIDEHVLSGPSEASTEAIQSLTLAVRLLAIGVAEQFRLARAGVVMSHDETAPRSLARAMFILASLHVRAGREDGTGSLHRLLALCTLPLTPEHWALQGLASPDFPYAGLRLLDPDSRVPSLDCAELARNGHSELDLREQLAFERLRTASDAFGPDAARAYTLLRQFVVENPVCTLERRRAFEREHQMQLASAFLASCYETVQPHHLVRGKLHLCPGCRTPRRTAGLEAHVRCATTQCPQFDKPVPTGTGTAELDGIFIAKPEVLLYWVGPGLDEVQLFLEAQRNKISATLYPDRDTTDLSLDGGATGVDVKSHSSPFLLAETLRRSIGGLALFKNRIIAINDQSVARFPGYLDILSREAAGLGLTFMSVAQVRRSLVVQE